MVTDSTDGLPSSYAQPVSLLTELWLFNQAPLFWGPSLLPGMHVWTDLKARAWTGSIRITREHAGNYIRGPHSWIRNSRGGNSNLCFIKFPRRFWCALKFKSPWSKPIAAFLFPLPAPGLSWVPVWQMGLRGSLLGIFQNALLVHRQRRLRGCIPTPPIFDSDVSCLHVIPETVAAILYPLGDKPKHQTPNEYSQGLRQEKTERAWIPRNQTRCWINPRNTPSVDSLLNNNIL